MPQTPSTRWCPTPEQVMILEEMYRSGVRTPNAAQIQQITAHLSFYGKIEGKNVFYWFQNHKARERQKLRRRLCRHHQLLLLNNHHHQQAAVSEDVSPPPPSPTTPTGGAPLTPHGLLLPHPHTTVASCFCPQVHFKKGNVVSCIEFRFFFIFLKNIAGSDLQSFKIKNRKTKREKRVHSRSAIDN